MTPLTLYIQNPVNSHILGVALLMILYHLLEVNASGTCIIVTAKHMIM